MSSNLSETIERILARVRRSLSGQAPAADGGTDSSSRRACTDAIDPRLLAILVAAATAVTGRRVVLRRVTFIEQNTVSGWAEAGRNSIQTSHNLHRNVH